MTRCGVCGEKKEYVGNFWQPFGPDENPRAGFSFEGAHYRGFPVFKVCDECADGIRSGSGIRWKHKGLLYWMHPGSSNIENESMMVFR